MEQPADDAADLDISAAAGVTWLLLSCVRSSTDRDAVHPSDDAEHRSSFVHGRHTSLCAAEDA